MDADVPDEADHGWPFSSQIYLGVEAKLVKNGSEC